MKIVGLAIYEFWGIERVRGRDEIMSKKRKLLR